MFFSPCSVRRNREDFFSPEDEKSRDVDDENGEFYSLYTDKSTKTDFVKVGEMSKKILSILFCIIWLYCRNTCSEYQKMKKVLLLTACLLRITPPMQYQERIVRCRRSKMMRPILPIDEWWILIPGSLNACCW